MALRSWKSESSTGPNAREITSVPVSLLSHREPLTLFVVETELRNSSGFGRSLIGRLDRAEWDGTRP
jgi:hypothetical protein